MHLAWKFAEGPKGDERNKCAEYIWSTLLPRTNFEVKETVHIKYAGAAHAQKKKRGVTCF